MTGPEATIRPRSSADTGGKTQQVLAKLEAGGHINNMIRLLANSPNGFGPFVQMSNALLTQAALPPTLREVAILHLARARGATYQWEEHVAMSRRVGVTDAQHRAIAAGRIDDETAFNAGERLALRIAGKMARGDDLSAGDWRAMTGAWCMEAALDLVLTIAWWGGFVPLIINALRVQGLEEGPTT